MVSSLTVSHSLSLSLCLSLSHSLTHSLTHSYTLTRSIHLIVTTCREKRLEVLKNRKEHFTTSLPTVDHIAFITNDTTFVENTLIREKVFYRRFDPKDTNITQLFIFDPDGNVVEVSSCGIPIGETKCADRQVMLTSSTTTPHLSLQIASNLGAFSPLASPDHSHALPRSLSLSDHHLNSPQTFLDGMLSWDDKPSLDPILVDWGPKLQ
jgi:hypothetical protein